MNRDNGSESLEIEVDVKDSLVQKVKRVPSFKKCKRCGRNKETTANFATHKRSADGYYHVCKECAGEAISKGFAKSRARQILVQGPDVIENLSQLTSMEQVEAIATLNFPSPTAPPKPAMPKTAAKPASSLFTIMQMIVEELSSEDIARLVRMLAVYEEPSNA